jgi:predicted RNA methylase
MMPPAPTSHATTPAAQSGAPEADHVYLFDDVVVRIAQPPSVWQLTPHGQTIGEGMAAARHGLIGKTVLEIGAGTGVHAIAALKLGARTVDVTDIDPLALQSCRDNARRNNVALRNTWRHDWLDFTPPAAYDALICNPPFCKAEPGNRRFFIRELISKSPRFLRTGGHLLFVQSSMADFSRTERELADAGFRFDAVHERRYPFRAYYFDAPDFLAESRRVPSGFEQIDGIYVETLRVYRCTRP